jgi:Flp pilus assembly protein TadG
MRRIRSGPTKGKGNYVSRLTPEASGADEGSMHPQRRRNDREGGQALVEFALIAPLFLMIVVGIIQFGVALNFWLDMQRLANQGARAGAVNCGSASNQCGTNLATNLAELAVSNGNNPTVEICYVPPSDPVPAGWTPSAGDAIRVTLKQRFGLQAIVNLAGINLKAQATMRLEQDPTSASLPARGTNTNWVLASHTPPQACAP